MLRAQMERKQLDPALLRTPDKLIPVPPGEPRPRSDCVLRRLPSTQPCNAPCHACIDAGPPQSQPQPVSGKELSRKLERRQALLLASANKRSSSSHSSSSSSGGEGPGDDKGAVGQSQASIPQSAARGVAVTSTRVDRNMSDTDSDSGSGGDDYEHDFSGSSDKLQLPRSSAADRMRAIMRGSSSAGDNERSPAVTGSSQLASPHHQSKRRKQQACPQHTAACLITL